MMTDCMGKSYCVADGSLSSSGKTAGSSGVEKYASDLSSWPKCMCGSKRGRRSCLNVRFICHLLTGLD